MMKSKLFVLCATILVCGCRPSDVKYVIFESDLDELFNQVESMEKHVGRLVSNGMADEGELSELQSEISKLKGTMEDAFMDAEDVGPVHVRR